MSLVVTTGSVDDVPVVTLEGDLDIYTVDHFREAMAQYSRHRAVVVEMVCVELVDSSGLGALLSLIHSSEGPRTVALVCEGPMMPKLLDLAGLKDRFVVTEDRQEAVEAATRHPSRAPR